MRLGKSSNESAVVPRRIPPAVPREEDGKMGEIDLEVADVLAGGGEREYLLHEGGR